MAQIVKFESWNVDYSFSKYSTIRVQKLNEVRLFGTLKLFSESFWSPSLYHLLDLILFNVTCFPQLSIVNFIILRRIIIIMQASVKANNRQPQFPDKNSKNWD